MLKIDIDSDFDLDADGGNPLDSLKITIQNILFRVVIDFALTLDVMMTASK